MVGPRRLTGGYIKFRIGLPFVDKGIWVPVGSIFFVLEESAFSGVFSRAQYALVLWQSRVGWMMVDDRSVEIE